MARYAYTLTLPTITGSHSNFPVLFRDIDFPAAAIDGGSTSILNGGGNLRAYTDDTKATQLPVDVFAFVTGGTPQIHVEVKIPTAATSNTIYIEADTVAVAQPAVTGTYGRNAVWADYEFVSHDAVTDSTGNYPNAFTVSGNPTQANSPYGISNGSYDFDGTGDFIDVDVSSRDPLNGVSANDMITMQAMLTSSSTDLNNRALHIRSAGLSGIQVMQNGDVADTYGFGSLHGLGNTTPRYKSSADVTVFNSLTCIVDFDGSAAPSASDVAYINGDGTGQSTSGTALGDGTDVDAIRIGARTDGNGTYFGKISEIKFRKSELSADWIATEETNRDIDAITSWGTVGAWEDQDAGSGFTLDIDGGIYSYSGSSVSVLANMLVNIDGGTYSYSGGSIPLLRGYALLVDGGTYSYVGSPTTLVYDQIGGFTLDIDGGDYSYSGSEVSTTHDRLLAANGGTYSYVGSQVALLHGRALSVFGGDYSYTGGNIDALYNRAIQTDGGIYSYTGANVGLSYSGLVTLLIDGYSVQFKQDDYSAEYQADTARIDYGSLQ